MQTGSYQTKRGKRYRFELSTGKVIRGLTESEFKEIWKGIAAREKARKG